ncbi:MAG: hypothetical protein AAF518_05865 [Spirochaetota bacterium]
MKKSLVAFLFVASLFVAGCSNTEENKDTENALLFGLVQQTNTISTLQSSRLEIEGYYYTGFFSSGTLSTAFSSNLVITSNLSTQTGSWSSVGSSSDGIFRIIEYDNSSNTLYYQNSSNSSFNASKYGKIVWTEKTTSCESGQTAPCFYYCSVVFSADSLAAAKADTTSFDSSDPQNSGCGSFAWSIAFTKSDNTAW